MFCFFDATADGLPKNLDFGHIPKLLWLEPGVVLEMSNLNVTGEASRRVGVLTAQWQINGSPLWPTVDGMPGHAVIMDNLNMVRDAGCWPLLARAREGDELVARRNCC